MSKNIPELYGSLVFSDSEMKSRLPKDIYRALAKTIHNGTHLELDVANAVAVAMKEWALEHGATHFTHRRRRSHHGILRKRTDQR